MFTWIDKASMYMYFVHEISKVKIFDQNKLPTKVCKCQGNSGVRN